MTDPVLAADGHTYERCVIEQWLAAHDQISPVTGAAIGTSNLIPNLAVRSLVARLHPEVRLKPWRLLA